VQLSLRRPTSRSYTTAFLDFILTNFAIIPSGQICLSIFVPRSIQMGPEEVLCFRAVRPSVCACVRARMLGQKHSPVGLPLH